MRSTFFEKAGEVKEVANFTYIFVQNKVDANKYALQRVQAPQHDYVIEAYSKCIHPNFLHYYTCWEETETVIREKPKEEKRESLISKKKSMNAFLSRKSKGDEILNSKKTLQLESELKFKEAEKKIEDKEDVSVMYVQLEPFNEIEPPKNVEEAKEFMAIVYLLAQQIHRQLGFWPKMIPVASYNSKLRFIKKGKSRNEELKRLFFYFIKNVNIANWSEEMKEAVEMYELNGDLNALVTRIDEDLHSLMYDEYSILFKGDKGFQEEVARLIDIDVVAFEKEGCELPLQQFTIHSSEITPSQLQLKLTHQLFEEVIIRGPPTNFLIKYLEAMKVN